MHRFSGCTGPAHGAITVGAWEKATGVPRTASAAAHAQCICHPCRPSASSKSQLPCMSCQAYSVHPAIGHLSVFMYEWSPLVLSCLRAGACTSATSMTRDCRTLSPFSFATPISAQVQPVLPPAPPTAGSPWVRGGPTARPCRAGHVNACMPACMHACMHVSIHGYMHALVLGGRCGAQALCAHMHIRPRMRIQHIA